MGEREAVENRAHLHGDRLARRCRRATPARPASTDESTRSRPPVGEHDVEPAVARRRRRRRCASLPSSTARFSSNRTGSGGAQLAGNLALAHVLDVIDMRGDRRDDRCVSPCGDERREPVGKFLGDEAGRQPPRAPALVLHQRRKERDVVADAVDDEGVERVRLRLDRAQRGRRAWVTSLAIIGS